MSNDELLTDDYVAGLLSQEANDCSLKYSALGMEAYRQEKKPANMMKPNTRFLRHIIRDTDTHNRNLLAKEAAESRARLRDLERAEEIKRRKTNPNAQDIRRRQMGDIHAILGGKMRRREEKEESPARSRESRDHECSRPPRKDKDFTRDRHDDRKQHGRLSRTEGHHSRAEERSRRDERKRSRRSRSRGSGSEEGRRHRSRRKRDRSASPRRRRRSQSPKERKSRHRHRSPIEHPRKDSKRTANDDGSDSDPLDELIGPAPPPRYRGRGALGSSGIDRRFSESYDPKTDGRMDEDDTTGSNDWDDAAEAFRDRLKLRQNQEQRLRAAGFAEKEIEKATGSTDKADPDVRWSKAGEKREWDLGKDADLDNMPMSDEL